MSNEIKVGDKVRVSKDAPKMFRCGFNHVYTTYISKVLEVDDGNAIIEMTMANMRCQERIIIPTKYLVKVDAEAKETFEDQIRDVLNGVEHQDFGRPIQTAMINLDINDWDAYAADLAKELALKVANKYDDPKEAAEYAVSVAKAVVEELKRK